MTVRHYDIWCRVHLICLGFKNFFLLTLDLTWEDLLKTTVVVQPLVQSFRHCGGFVHMCFCYVFITPPLRFITFPIFTR